jgi:hypothetical protein
MEGVEEDSEPPYQWVVTTEYQGTDDLYLITITVSWLEGIRPYSVTAQTLLDGTSAGSSSSTNTSADNGGQQQTP